MVMVSNRNCTCCKNSDNKLTFTELEAFTCARLSRFLSLDLAGVAGEETFCLERRTVSLGVNLAKCAGNAKSHCFSLTFDTAS